MVTSCEYSFTSFSPLFSECFISQVLKMSSVCGICLEDCVVMEECVSTRCCRKTWHASCLMQLYFSRGDDEVTCPNCRGLLRRAIVETAPVVWATPDFAPLPVIDEVVPLLVEGDVPSVVMDAVRGVQMAAMAVESIRVGPDRVISLVNGIEGGASPAVEQAWAAVVRAVGMMRSHHVHCLIGHGFACWFWQNESLRLLRKFFRKWYANDEHGIPRCDEMARWNVHVTARMSFVCAFAGFRRALYDRISLNMAVGQWQQWNFQLTEVVYDNVEFVESVRARANEMIGLNSVQDVVDEEWSFDEDTVVSAEEGLQICEVVSEFRENLREKVLDVAQSFAAQYRVGNWDLVDCVTPVESEGGVSPAALRLALLKAISRAEEEALLAPTGVVIEPLVRRAIPRRYGSGRLWLLRPRVRSLSVYQPPCRRLKPNKTNLRMFRTLARLRKSMKHVAPESAQFESDSMFQVFWRKMCYFGECIKDWTSEKIRDYVKSLNLVIGGVFDVNLNNASFERLVNDVRTDLYPKINSAVDQVLHLTQMLDQLFERVRGLCEDGVAQWSDFGWLWRCLRSIVSNPVLFVCSLYFLVTAKDLGQSIAAVVALLSVLGVTQSVVEMVVRMCCPTVFGGETFFEANPTFESDDTYGDTFERLAELFSYFSSSGLWDKMRTWFIPLFSIGGLMGKQSGLAGFLKNLRTAAAGVKEARKTLDEMEDAFDELGFQVSDRTRFMAALKKDILDLVYEVDRLEYMADNCAAVFCQPTAYRQFCDFQAKMNDVRTRIATFKYDKFVSTTMNTEVIALTRRMHKVAAKVGEVRSKEGTRPTPVAICFHGYSGIGKSHSSAMFISKVKRTLEKWYRDDPEKFYMFEDAREWSVWNEQNRDQYDTGYEGQQIHYVDDAFVDASQMDHPKFLAFISNTRVGTVQAALEAKGKAYNVRMVLVNCNVFPDRSKTITNMDALYSRFARHYYQVYSEGDFEADCSNLAYYNIELPDDVFPSVSTVPRDPQTKCVMSRPDDARLGMDDVVERVCLDLYANYLTWEYRESEAQAEWTPRDFHVDPDAQYEAVFPDDADWQVQVVTADWRIPGLQSMRDVRVIEGEMADLFNVYPAMRRLRLVENHPWLSIHPDTGGMRLVEFQLRDPGLVTAAWVLKGILPGGYLELIRGASVRRQFDRDLAMTPIVMVYADGVSQYIFHVGNQRLYQAVGVYFVQRVLSLRGQDAFVFVHNADYIPGQPFTARQMPQYSGFRGKMRYAKERAQDAFSVYWARQHWFSAIFNMPSFFCEFLFRLFCELFGMDSNYFFMLIGTCCASLLGRWMLAYLAGCVLQYVVNQYTKDSVEDAKNFGGARWGRVYPQAKSFKPVWRMLDFHVQRGVRDYLEGHEWCKDIPDDYTTRDVERVLGMRLRSAKLRVTWEWPATVLMAAQWSVKGCWTGTDVEVVTAQVLLMYLGDRFPELTTDFIRGKWKDDGFAYLGQPIWEARDLGNQRSWHEQQRPEYSFETSLENRVFRMDVNLFDFVGAPMLHCVSYDMRMSQGLARGMCEQFAVLRSLRDMGPNVTLSERAARLRAWNPASLQHVVDSTTGFLSVKDEDTLIINMVTKRYASDKPTLEAFATAFETVAKVYKGLSLAIPYRLGCGRDKLCWEAVVDVIHRLAKQYDLSIIICAPQDQKDRYYESGSVDEGSVESDPHVISGEVVMLDREHEHVCPMCQARFSHSHVMSSLAHRPVAGQCPNENCIWYSSETDSVLIELKVEQTSTDEFKKFLKVDPQLLERVNKRVSEKTTWGSAVAATRTRVFLPDSPVMEGVDDLRYEGLIDQNSLSLIAAFTRKHIVSVCVQPNDAPSMLSAYSKKCPYGHTFFGWRSKNCLITPAHTLSRGRQVVAWQKETEKLFAYEVVYLDTEADLAVSKAIVPSKYSGSAKNALSYPEVAPCILSYLPRRSEYGDATKPFEAYQYLPDTSIIAPVRFTYVGRVCSVTQTVLGKEDVMVTQLLNNTTTGPGDCGAPLFVSNPRAPQKLVGMHHVGTSTVSYSALVYREKISALLDRVPLEVPGVLQAAEGRVTVVTGGVCSSLGKGQIAASIAKLKARDCRVTVMKVDPYLNVSAGDLSPDEHGEGYVLKDGSVVDLDFGTYERVANVVCDERCAVTTGKLMSYVAAQNVSGRTRQVSMLADELVRRVESVLTDYDHLVIEVGGTVGEDEAVLYKTALRQILTRWAGLHVHVTYVVRDSVLGGDKTKPAQLSVAAADGVFPVGLVVVRSVSDLDAHVVRKVVHSHENVVIPHLQDLRCVESILSQSAMFGAAVVAPSVVSVNGVVRVAIVGKYSCDDAYHSLIVQIQDAASRCGRRAHVVCVNSERFEKDPRELVLLTSYHSVVLPGGYGARGFDGMVQVAQFCLDRKIRLLGVCFGFQAMCVAVNPGCSVVECDESKLSVTVKRECERAGEVALSIPRFAIESVRFRHSYAVPESTPLKGLVVEAVLDGDVVCVTAENAVGCQFHPEFGTGCGGVFDWLVSGNLNVPRFQATTLKSLEELVDRRSPICTDTVFDRTAQLVDFDASNLEFLGSGYVLPVGRLVNPANGKPHIEWPTAVQQRGGDLVEGKARVKHRTLFHGVFGVDRRPSVLSPRDPRIKSLDHIPFDGLGNRNLLVHQTNLYRQIDDKKIDLKMLADITDQIVDYMLTVVGNADIGFADVFEAVAGDPDTAHAEPMNLNSSNGLPWSLMGAKSGHDMFGVENGELHIKDDVAVQCLQAAQEKLELAREGVRTFSVWKNCLKDELRPSAKIEEPKSRLFVAAPRTVTIAFRSLFYRFKAVWTLMRDSLFHAVGINVKSYEWARVRYCLAQHPHIFDVDFEAFDKRELTPFIWAAGKIVCDVIELVTGDGWYEARLTLWEEIIYTLCVSYSTVFMKLNGNPSGNPMTTVLNCIVHLLYFVYCFFKLVAPSFVLFCSMVWFTCFGDDGVYSVSDACWARFNFESCRDILLDIGQVVTPGVKTKDLSHMQHELELDEVSFLKRKFWCYGKNQHIVLAPLEKVSIEATMEWSAIPCGDTLSWVVTLRECLLEAACWGQNYYDVFRRKLQRALMAIPAHNSWFARALAPSLTLNWAQAIALYATRYTGCLHGDRNILKNIELFNVSVGEYSDYAE